MSEHTKALAELVAECKKANARWLSQVGMGAIDHKVLRRAVEALDAEQFVERGMDRFRAGEAKLIATTAPSAMTPEPSTEAMRLAAEIKHAWTRASMRRPEFERLIDRLAAIAATALPAPEQALTDLSNESQKLGLYDAPAPVQEPVAWGDVKAERARQINVEGWIPEHDDEHESDELARAAAVYANPDLWDVLGAGRVSWPEYWDGPKFKDKRRNLIKAGALILAEIERLDRAAQPLRDATPEQEEEFIPTNDFLGGHQCGLEWAAQLAAAGDPRTGDWLYDDREDLAAAIRKGPEMPVAAPEQAGWVSVPREITEAMHQAAVRTIVNCTGNDDFPPRVWAAMLAAAIDQARLAQKGGA